MVNFDLRHGDCLDILKTLDEDSVDLLLVDLPYGTTACKWDSVLPLDELWKEYYRVCKKSAAMVFTAAQPFTTTLIASNFKHFKYEWIWEKPQGTNPMCAKSMPLKSHENIVVFCRQKTVYNPQMTQGTPYKGFSSDSSKIGEVYGSANSVHRDNPDGTRYPKTVLRFKQEKGFHPTQKPVALMEYLINTYSNPNDVVLDNTMGSGTTGVACKNLGRSFIGIEKEVKYFEIAKSRIFPPPVLDPTLFDIKQN